MSVPRTIAGFPVGELLALEELEGSESETVYLSGSIVEGFGNRGSDVDIFVIGRGQPRHGVRIDKERFSIALHFHEDRRIDFEYWPETEIEGLVARLAAIRPGGEEFVAEKLELAEETFVHRVKIGVPLQHPERLEALRARFDFERFRAYLVQQSIHRIDGTLEDLTGMLDDGDLDVALLRSRDLVGFVTDAFGHSRGNTNSLPKWRPKILERLPASDQTNEVIRGFWELGFPDAVRLRAAPEALRRHVIRTIEFAHRVVTWLQP